MVVAVAAVAVGAGANAARVVAVFACCPAGGVAVEDVETVARGLHSQLRNRICIVVSYA